MCGFDLSAVVEDGAAWGYEGLFSSTIEISISVSVVGCIAFLRELVVYGRDLTYLRHINTATLFLAIP